MERPGPAAGDGCRRRRAASAQCIETEQGEQERDMAAGGRFFGRFGRRWGSRSLATGWVASGATLSRWNGGGVRRQRSDRRGKQGRGLGWSRGWAGAFVMERVW